MIAKKPASSKKRREQRSHTTGDVGYGRPPREQQFQPGQSGNPKGRPRGSKNEATMLHELLYRKIPVREAGRTRKITVLEAILLRFTEDSLKGNTKSATFLLNRHNLLSSGKEPVPDVLPDEDKEILEAFARRLVTQQSPEKKR
jgi:hypothetical protein